MMYDPGQTEPHPMYEVDQIYADRVRAAVKQPSSIEWSTSDNIQAGSKLKSAATAVAAQSRGDEYTDVITCMVFPALRLGFLVQAIALGLILCFYHGHGGHNAFTFDLYNFPERLRTSSSFCLTIVGLMSVYGLGLLALIFFQSFLPDNAKLSRGFRAGSKLFSSALTLDFFVLALRLLAFIYGYHFLQNRWWLHYHQTELDFSLFYFGALLHGISLILYGLGLFYMECYHDEGTYEEFGWILLSVFGLAGLAEIAMVLTGWGACFTFIQLGALVAATIWSMSFEPLVQYHSSPLHDRCINDEMIFGQQNGSADNAYELADMP